jgi:hypothetical protein
LGNDFPAFLLIVDNHVPRVYSADGISVAAGNTAKKECQKELRISDF